MNNDKLVNEATILVIYIQFHHLRSFISIKVPFMEGWEYIPTEIKGEGTDL